MEVRLNDAADGLAILHNGAVWTPTDLNSDHDLGTFNVKTLDTAGVIVRHDNGIAVKVTGNNIKEDVFFCYYSIGGIVTFLLLLIQHF